MKTRDFLLSLVMMVSMITITVCNANTSLNQDDDFSGNSVIVIMTKEAGGVNKIHDKEIFGDIASQIIEIKDLTYYEDPEKININWEKFQQILIITLNRNDKKNVLKVVKYLNQLDAVESAHPDWYMHNGV